MIETWALWRNVSGRDVKRPGPFSIHCLAGPRFKKVIVMRHVFQVDCLADYCSSEPHFVSVDGAFVHTEPLTQPEALRLCARLAEVFEPIGIL